MELNKVIRVGNSYAVTIPRSMLDDMSLKAGDYVKVSRSEAGIAIIPVRDILKRGAK